MYYFRRMSLMSISFVSLRWMHSSFTCPWLLWNRQYLVMFVLGLDDVLLGKQTLTWRNYGLAHSDRIGLREATNCMYSEN